MKQYLGSWAARAHTASRARRAGAALAAVSIAGVAFAGPATAGTIHPGSADQPTPIGPRGGRLAAVSGAEGEYTPVTPYRFLDTRSGLGAPTGALPATGERAVTVLGIPGVPASDVSAVVVNVTAVTPSAPGFLKVFPNGSALPDVSNVNFAAGQTVANLVTVGVGSEGRINVFNSNGSTHVVGDIVGYYATATGTPGGRFASAQPQRILDTRSGLGAPGGKPQQGGTVTLDIKNRGGVPLNATAVVLNVTATDADANGWLAVTPHSSGYTVSSVNYTRGETRANLVTVGLPADGRVDFTTLVRANIVADVMGWYTEDRVGERGRFIPVDPFRLLDTRDTPYWAFPDPDGWVSYRVGPGATALALNVTAVAPFGPGFLSVAPADVPAPTTSNINFAGGGDAVPNHVLTGLSTKNANLGGQSIGPNAFVVRAGVAPADVVIDAFGIFLDVVPPSGS